MQPTQVSLHGEHAIASVASGSCDVVLHMPGGRLLQKFDQQWIH